MAMDKKYEDFGIETINILKEQCESVKVDALKQITSEQAEKCTAIIEEYSYVPYDYGIKGIVNTGLPWSPLDRVAMIKNLGKVFDIDMSIDEAGRIDEKAIKNIFMGYQPCYASETSRIFWGRQSSELSRTVGWTIVNMLAGGSRKEDVYVNEFDKVIGYEEVKNDLKKYADVLRNPEKYSKQGVYLSGGILLYGEHGMGKTLLAECFIAESGLKSYTIRKDKPDSGFLTYINNTFDDAAKNDRGAIIFLDDLDRFSNEDSEQKNAEEYLTIQSCIDKYKESGIFVIATANDINKLPSSLIRFGRIGKKYEMKFPMAEEAEQILGSLLEKYNVAEDVDVRELSRLMTDQACADYKNVINEAGILASYEGRDKICNMDIVKSYLKLIYKVPETMSSFCNVNNSAVALHEAGHVVVGELLEPGCITAVTIKRSADEKGAITLSYHGSECILSNKLRMYQLIRILAGKAATDIVTGESDYGCRSDVRRVVDQLGSWIEDYCINDFNVFWKRDCSEALAERKERMITTEMDKLYKEAKRILIENRPFLDAVVEALLEKEILIQKDIQIIKNKIYGGYND